MPVLQALLSRYEGHLQFFNFLEPNLHDVVFKNRASPRKGGATRFQKGGFPNEKVSLFIHSHLIFPISSGR